MAKRLRWLVLIVLAAGCGPKVMPALPTVTMPKYPSFIVPVVPVAFANSAAAVAQTRGWTFLQAGDLKSAEREFSAALSLAPAFYPAEISLGWVGIARQDGKAALSHFDKALERLPGNASALVGRGEAELVLNHEPEALMAFEGALIADPSLTDIARRVEVLKLRGLQEGLAGARAAVRAGKLDEAIRAYQLAIQSSPTSPFLYRELAIVERQSGDNVHALEHFQRAAELDASDSASFTQIGELLEAAGDFEGAAKAYNAAIAIEPSADLQARLEAIRARSDLARLPAEYRAIPDSAQVTRGELAALIGVRLAPLLQPDRQQPAVLITDLRNQWAAAWIVTVSRAGVMEPFSNHAFQPRVGVRRVDFAPIVARLLTRAKVVSPARAKAWEGARLKFSDLAPGHLAYAAASSAVASGVMTIGADGAFQPTRAVSGAEAIEAIDRIAALADLASGSGRGRP